MEDIRKKMREVHDEVPPDYYDTSIAENPFQRYWHKTRTRVLSSMLKGEEETVLDIGCGGGTLLDMISRGAGLKRSFGVDASFGAIKYAAEHHTGPRYICADFYELPFKDSSFGAITAIEVLEHLHDPATALKELRRCIRSGGRILILVPNENNILFRVIWFFWTMGKGKVWKEAHLQKFTRRSLSGLVNSTGFRVVETRDMLLGMLIAVKGVKE